MNSSGSILEWDDLALWRGERCLQTALSGKLPSGKAVTLRGPNGCGKTTLLRTLCGLSEAEQGRVLWGGKPIQSNRSIFHSQLAYAGHQPGLKADLSTRENLHFAAELEGESPDISALLHDLNLNMCADIPARSLSAGQRRRASLARVLGTRRILWVLDEPFTNIDDAGRRWLSGQFNAHLERGGMLLMAAHQDTGIAAGAEQVIELETQPA